MKSFPSPSGSPDSSLRLSLFSVSAGTLPTAHHDTGKAEWPGTRRICSTCFQAGSVTVGPAQSPVLWNSVLILLTFFKHTNFFCFLILAVHSNTQGSSGHQGRAGLAVSLCAHRLVHAHAWQDDHVSSMTPTVDNNSSGIYERKHENWRTTFPCFSRKNRINL